jgi:hypothetical protein
MQKSEQYEDEENISDSGSYEEEAGEHEQEELADENQTQQ